MDPIVVGIIGVVALLVLIIIRVPIAYALAGIGLLGSLYLMGMTRVLAYYPHIIYSNTSKFTFTAIPLFLLMGYFAFYAGITDEAYDVARAWVGKIPGGLGIATVGGCALFAATAGSSLAECAAMAKIAVPEMVKSGYSKRFATGIVASAGGLAVVIPPSIIMVIYGVATETSVGQLLVAGILPGIVYTLVFAIAIWLFALLKPSSAPLEQNVDTSWKARVQSLNKLKDIVILFGVSIGGIYAGIVTPTEGAALGAVAAFAITFVKKRLTWEVFKTTVMETAKASTIIFLLFAGANIFTIFVTYTGVVDAFAQWLIGLGLSKTMLFSAIIFMYIILGCFLDSISMMILTLPFVIPIIEAQGLSLIWFGVIMCMVVEIGCITPPMGLNVYVMKAAMGDSIELTEIFAGALPFVILMVTVVYILYTFPIIALWLPSLMK
jgi:C4-dicarboxylate transporter, DctM subunit